MTKKLALVLAAASLIPAASWAKDSGAGCGLGSMIVPPSKKVVFQVVEATTNGSFGSQTFGITSGTSNCTNDGIVFNSEKVNVFVASNLDSLKEDMARGQGQNLASLANLLAIDSADQPAFYTLTQAKFSTLVPSAQTSSTELVTSLTEAMAAHPELARYVAPQA